MVLILLRRIITKNSACIFYCDKDFFYVNIYGVLIFYCTPCIEGINKLFQEMSSQKYCKSYGERNVVCGFCQFLHALATFLIWKLLCQQKITNVKITELLTAIVWNTSAIKITNVNLWYDVKMVDQVGNSTFLKID